MYLDELLTDVTFTNSKSVATPIELSYYEDDYKWEDDEPYEGMFFASLDYAFIGSADFKNGEVKAIEVTDLGIEIHVVTG